jgi:hypothetical protein
MAKVGKSAGGQSKDSRVFEALLHLTSFTGSSIDLAALFRQSNNMEAIGVPNPHKCSINLYLSGL